MRRGGRRLHPTAEPPRLAPSPRHGVSFPWGLGFQAPRNKPSPHASPGIEEPTGCEPGRGRPLAASCLWEGPIPYGGGPVL
jgi:hypothetical protein